MPNTEQNKSTNTPRKILGLFRRYKGLLIAALLLTTISSALQIGIITLVQPFLDDVIPAIKGAASAMPDISNDSDLAPSDMSMVRSFIFLLMMLFIIFGITGGTGLYISILFGQKIVFSLREKILNHLQELSLSFFEDRKTGSIMSWITNDINVFRIFSSNQLNSFVNNFVQVIGSLVICFKTSWELALISLFIIPLLALIIQKAGSSMRKATRRVQDKLADISAVLHETVSAIPIIKSFGTEEHEKDKFATENIGTFKAEMKKARISAILQPSIQLSVALGLCAILFYGLNQMANGEITMGKLFTFVILLQVMAQRATRLGQTYANLNELFAAGDRLFEFLDIKSEITEIENPVEFKDIKGDVTFKNVNFAYDKKNLVLKNIDLDVPSGKVIALVGPSGAGKSSMAKLLPRFYDPTGGEILIDGTDIKTASIDSLRAQLGIVPQETILFSTTIKENIAYGRLDASTDEIIAAAKAANAHEFIESLPDGYSTIVGERGSKLSGGQAQRVSIARAILKNPRILILDEATSSLDAQSEELVQQALEKLMAGRTTFIIAHRLTTIQNADEIIVLSAGEIAQRGTHDQLLNTDGIYRNLYQMQTVDTNGDIDQPIKMELTEDTPQ